MALVLSPPSACAMAISRQLTKVPCTGCLYNRNVLCGACERMAGGPVINPEGSPWAMGSVPRSSRLSRDERGGGPTSAHKSGWPGAPSFAYFAKGGILRTPCAKRLRLDGQSLADYFPLSSHNDSQKSSFKSPSGTSSSRRLSAGSCWQRPKLRVTPYPGRFCRELLCYHDFTAQPCP